MSYEAEHPKGTDIIKLDDAEHSTNIQRVSCETDEDLEGDDHLTILHMKDSKQGMYVAPSPFFAFSFAYFLRFFHHNSWQLLE